MRGKKTYTEKLFTTFQLPERGSAHNKYRRLMELLDLGFLDGTTAHLYGSSIDIPKGILQAHGRFPKPNKPSMKP
jgi:hypothetical protein